MQQSNYARNSNKRFSSVKGTLTSSEKVKHTNWMMLNNPSNHRGAAWLLAHEIPAADAGRFESYVSRKLFSG